MLPSLKIAEPEGYGRKGSNKQGKAAFADGTAVPAKRPRTSNTADPDAMRSSKRVPAITDFFNSITNSTAASSSTATEAGRDSVASAADRARVQQQSCDTAAAHPASGLESEAIDVGPCDPASMPSADSSGAITTVPRFTGGLSHQQPQSELGVVSSVDNKAGQPPVDSMRRIMADAALRRLAAQQGADDSCAQLIGSSHRQEPTGATAIPDSSAGNVTGMHAEDTVDVDTCVNAHDRDAENTAPVSAVIDLIDDADESSGMHAEVGLQQVPSMPADSSQPSCPVCGHRWPKHTSYSDINEHMDACLKIQLL